MGRLGVHGLIWVVCRYNLRVFSVGKYAFQKKRTWTRILLLKFVPVSRIWQLSNPESVASRHGITWRDWGVLESACRWLSFYRDSWQRRFTGSVIEDTSDSEGDLPRTRRGAASGL